jgi:hypothetical protein
MENAGQKQNVRGFCLTDNRKLKVFQVRHIDSGQLQHASYALQRAAHKPN